MEQPILINIYNNIYDFIDKNKLVPLFDKIDEPSKFYNEINTNKYVTIPTISKSHPSEKYEEVKNSLNTNKYNDDVKLTYILLLHYDSEYSSKTPVFKSLINSIKYNNINIIIISKDPLSTHVNKQVVELSNDTKKIFNYTYDRFKIILYNHVLCSPHTLLSKDEEEYLLKNILKKKKSHLPKIKLSDPQVIWIGGNIGDIVRIDRDSEITGKSIYYRVVING